MDKGKTPYIIVLFGPTAVGKTDVSFAISEHINTEIINMDVGQFYTPLSIGTAKPDWKEVQPKHHLFDILDTPRNFTVLEYRQRLTQLLEEIWARNNVPLIVGGSGFYLYSLLFAVQDGLDFMNVDDLYKDKDPWNALYEIDPERALQINKHDTYRILRALSIWHTTHKKPSTNKPVYDPVSSYIVFNLERNRDEIYDRINKRVVAMLEAGFLKEVSLLKDSEWEPFLEEKKIIGYNDLLLFLKSHDQTELSLNKTVELIQKKTRNYAKRQITFWRMLKKKLSLIETCDNVKKGFFKEINLSDDFSLNSVISYCNAIIK